MADSIIHELTDTQLDSLLPLLGEIECGRHFSASDPQHLAWLKRRLSAHRAAGIRYFGGQNPAGEILGVVGILLEQKLFGPPGAEITDIGVIAAQRRRGLGTQLLRHAVNLAIEHGAHAVFVRTYAADIGAIAFYGRSAFYPVAVIPGANGATDEGDIVLRRNLSVP